MMKTVKLTIGLLGVMLFSACSDFLKESSQDEVIVQTVTDYAEFLLGSGYPQPAVSIPYGVLYLVDDDVEVNEARLTASDNTTVSTRYGYFTWQPDMWERVGGTTLANGYSQTYERIMGCNAVLDYIDEAFGDDILRWRTKAEAYAIRGLLYWQLVNMYAEPYNEHKEGLGVVLKLTSGLVENGMRRASVETVYENILSDLKRAEELFLRVDLTRGGYRINLTSVYMLLSRVYLYMERWEESIDAATKAIALSEGLSDYTQITATTIYLNNYELSEVELLFGAGRFDLSNGMNSSGYRPSQELLSLFPAGDQRLLWFSADRQSVLKCNTSVTPTSLLRISETYLNRAEAYVRQGSGQSQALADLNELRRHRIIGYTNVTITDATQLLNAIRVERRLELCFEAHRWFDLRRSGMPSISHVYRTKNTDPELRYTLNARDPLYTLPIPASMQEHNMSLEQNSSADAPERIGVPN